MWTSRILRRDEVLQYVVEKYGADCVAQIITFGTRRPQSRRARDAARALQVPCPDVDRICKLIPYHAQFASTAPLPGDDPRTAQRYESNPEIRQPSSTRRKARGVELLHASTHAAGVVISKEPLTNISCPSSAPATRRSPTTQFDFRIVEEVGLLKMDFLAFPLPNRCQQGPPSDRGDDGQEAHAGPDPHR